MSKEKAINLMEFINRKRLNSKNAWFYMDEVFEGISIRFNGYNTSIQIFHMNGLDYGGLWDLSVKDWKSYLVESIEREL